MARLVCGVNWFSGGTDGVEIITDPRLAGIAFIKAQCTAFAKAGTAIFEHYDLPCPASCPNKFGEYGLQGIFSTVVDHNATEDVVKAHCRVHWFLKVWCSEKIVAVPGPIAGDYEKLREEYVSSVPKE